MSRIGKKPILLPKGVKAKVEGGVVVIEGARGKLSLPVPAGIKIEVAADKIIVQRFNETKKVRSLHGTMRALISNIVEGVTQGFRRELEIVGVGYKSQLKGKEIVLNMGFSNPVEMPIPAELKVSTPLPTRIIVEGIDKQKVGEFAARIRRIYPPEPYKGKGIRYVGEEVRKKLGKALAK